MTFRRRPDGDEYDPFVSLRVPEELMVRLDENCENRSRFIREALREKLDTEDTIDVDLPTEDDLRSAYLALRESCRGRTWLPERAAAKQVAQVSGLDESTARRTLLVPLCERGYLTRRSDYTGQDVRYRVNHA